MAILTSVELKQSAERSDVGEYASRERRARQAANAADGFVAGIDVDPR
jgi:hypothetical protein